MSDVLSSYYEKAFENAGEGGTIYHRPLNYLEAAGHSRKLQLLDEIEIPNLASAVVLDYGVGSWGFGCVCPKLKNGKQLYGADISQFAVDASKKLSDADEALTGKSVQYFTSSGYDIKLPDEAVDVLFAGEVIEHIEDTETFVSELARVLRPDGTLIITTPNEQPSHYRSRGLRWALGFEHVALMDQDELIAALEEHFEVKEVRGFTSSLGPEIDQYILDDQLAEQIAIIGNKAPSIATGLIVVCRRPKQPKKPFVKYSHKIVEASEVNALPGYEDLSLFEDVIGRNAIGDEPNIEIPVPPDAARCNLIMWGHPWSGIAKIETACRAFEVDLYAHEGGGRRIVLNEPDLRGLDKLRVISTGLKREESYGTQCIYFRSVFAIK